MSTTSTGAVPATSVDTARLSILTSTPTGAVEDEPGRGVAYNPSQVGAGRLVHCHSTRDDMFLVAYSNIWTAATPNQATPGAFTAKTIIDKPYFGWVDTVTGGIAYATDRGGTPGVLYPTGIASPVLVGGASNGGMVYFLVTLGDVPALVMYRADKGTVDFCGSTWLNGSVPFTNGIAGEQVVWNKGVAHHGAYLYLVGEQPVSHTLFMCKKALVQGGKTLYLSAKGWSPYPADLSPLTSSAGVSLVSAGRVSLATFQDSWFMSTVAKPAANVVGSFMRAKHPLSGWSPLPGTVDLGTVSPVETSGVFFQQEVNANSAHPALASTDSIAGIPYTYTVEAATSLRTAWGILPVPRVRL